MTKTIIAQHPLRSTLRLSLAMLAGGLAGQAHALSFQPSEDFKVEWNTNLAYGLAWRTENPDKQLSAGVPNPLIANIDDGNNAFDSGSLISNRSSFLTEVNLNWRQDYGLFMRASGFYDDVYNRDNEIGRAHV